MNNSNEVPPVQKVLGFAPVRTPRLTRACKSNEKGGAAEHVNFSPNRRKRTECSLQNGFEFAPARAPRLARACKSNEKGGAAEHVSFSPNRRKRTECSLRRRRLHTARL